MSPWETLLPLNSLFTLITPTSEPRGWVLLHPRARTQFCHYPLPLRSTKLILVCHKYSRGYLQDMGNSEKTSCHQVHMINHPLARHTKMFRLLRSPCLPKYSQSCIFQGHMWHFLILQNLLWSSDLFVRKLEDVKTIRANLWFVLEQNPANKYVAVSC